MFYAFLMDLIAFYGVLMRYSVGSVLNPYNEAARYIIAVSAFGITKPSVNTALM